MTCILYQTCITSFELFWVIYTSYFSGQTHILERACLLCLLKFAKLCDTNSRRSLISATVGIPPQTNGYYHGYDAAIGAMLTNEFATAAYRFGHSLVQDWFETHKDGVANEQLNLVDVFGEPARLYSTTSLNTSSAACLVRSASFATRKLLKTSTCLAKNWYLQNSS